MELLRRVFQGYRLVERHIWLVVATQFGIQAVNTTFFLLLNYYMVHEGFADYQVADVLSYRFLAVCCLAFPLGLFIKGRRLIPFFYLAAIGVPICSQVLLYAISVGDVALVNGAAMAWGVAYTCMQITVLPFILLNARQDTHSEAFSLSFLSFSLTLCLFGALHFLLSSLLPRLVDEAFTLRVVAFLPLAGVFFLRKIERRERITARIPLRAVVQGYDWPLIFRALVPTSIIAIGAGFTIPVINLFFLNVHGVPAEVFSVVGSATFLLVAIVMIFMPYLRRNFGYSVAITLFQGASILALFMLATTEYYSDWWGAAGVALFFYMMRQPLMSAATPMTNELTMYYVGRNNQEIMSALNASIWSGSWFISMKIFGWLRQMDYRYVSIFLITVALYTVGVAWYAFLIRAYHRRTGNNGVERRTKKEAEASV